MKKKFYLSIIALMLSFALPSVYADFALDLDVYDSYVSNGGDTPSSSSADDTTTPSDDTEEDEPPKFFDIASEPTATPEPTPTVDPQATPEAYYILDGTKLDDSGDTVPNYDAETMTYTLNLYLETALAIETGSFGLIYDGTLADHMSFELSPEFSFVRNHTEWYKAEYSSKDGYVVPEYISFSWEGSGAKITYGTQKRYKIGTLKFSDVELNAEGTPNGWHSETLRLLNWYQTPISNLYSAPLPTDVPLPTYVPTPTPTVDEGFNQDDDQNTVNDEIYDPVTDLYRGQDMTDWYKYLNGELVTSGGLPDYRWVDIGFMFEPGFDLPVLEDIIISGTVYSYNENNDLEFSLKNSMEEAIEISPDSVTVTQTKDAYDRVKTTYTIQLDIPMGEYVLCLSKKTHLTYEKPLVISNHSVSAGTIELYCGDIDGDEKIKLTDRTLLINMMHKNQNASLSQSATFKACDLNGDGKVNMFDLGIFNKFYNKNYSEVIPNAF